MAKIIIRAQMKQRRDTKANWAATNPVLLDGELGIVSDDPNLYKVGDGATAWNSLPFRGFDGTLAQELGTSPNAVVSQKIVSEKLIDLESIKGYDVVIPSYSLTDDKYMLPSGKIASASGFSIIDSISLKAGETIILYAAGYEYNVSMIARKNSDGTYTNLVTSSGSNVKTYQYTNATSDTINVVLSFHNGKDYSLGVSKRVSKSEIASIQSLIKVGNYDVIVPSYTITNGQYIVSNGGLAPNSSFSLTSEIQLKAGETIVSNAAGYEYAVAMIARKNADGTYTNLVTSSGSDVQVYKYTNTSSETINVVLSFHNQKDYSFCISKRANPDALERKISPYTTFSIVEKFAVIGDSFASGQIFSDSGAALGTFYNQSWGQILARRTGAKCVNMSSPGLTTESWLGHPKGLSLLKSTEPQQVYILALGINDASDNGVPVGNFADIQNKPNTFLGNYSRIISEIQTHAPSAKIIISTLANKENVEYNNAILELAEYYHIPAVRQDQNGFFQSYQYQYGMVVGHPTAPLYGGMAVAMEEMLTNCILNNSSYFRALSL